MFKFSSIAAIAEIGTRPNNTTAHRQHTLDDFQNVDTIRSHLIQYHGDFLNSLSSNNAHRQSIVEDLCKNADIVEHKQGKLIFYQGDIAHEWFLILDGSVSIHVHTTADSSAFKKSDDLNKEKVQPKAEHHDTRRDEEEIRRRHCQGEILVLGKNGLFIEALPSSSRFPHYHTKDERKRLGIEVARMQVKDSFGQVALLNRTPRSASALSESCLLLRCDKALYDRTVRNTHVSVLYLCVCVCVCVC